ncbi:MAG TPA: AbrB/MazE/SpoVT family DNA-binding domain-containing protein [Patescibacteria group bacterium]|nr:AbrB/MazE/SpoVT family DNA-binding domain-containing protein [Patescibacteria group bacterium]
MAKKAKTLAGFHKKMARQDKFYGATTVGARGQVVIPAPARRDLGISPGDQLLVIGKFGRAIGLIKAEAMSQLVDAIMEHLAGSGAAKDFRKYLESSLLSRLKQSAPKA